MNTKQSDDFYSSEETSRRRDATIKRMLATPPKPHSAMKIGKSKERVGKKARTPATKEPQAEYTIGLSDVLSDTPAPMRAVMRKNSRALKEVTNKSHGSHSTIRKRG